MSKFVCYHGATAMKETAEALLVDVMGKEFWIPKSQIDDNESEVLTQGDMGRLVVTGWIAEKKDMGDPDEEYET